MRSKQRILIVKMRQLCNVYTSIYLFFPFLKLRYCVQYVLGLYFLLLPIFSYYLSMSVHFSIICRFVAERNLNSNNFLDTDQLTDIYFYYFLPVYMWIHLFYVTYPAEFALLLLHYPICKNILIVGKF